MIDYIDYFYNDDEVKTAKELEEYIDRHKLKEKLDTLYSHDELLDYARFLIGDAGNKVKFTNLRKASSIIEALTENTCEYYSYDMDGWGSVIPAGIDSIDDLKSIYHYELQSKVEEVR